RARRRVDGCRLLDRAQRPRVLPARGPLGRASRDGHARVPMLKYLLLSPLTWLFAALVAAIFLCRGRRALVLGLATAALWLLTAPLGANLLVAALEGPREPRSACVLPPDGVHVLLAGGFEGPESEEGGIGALAPESFRRTAEAARELKALPSYRLLISGGGGHVRPESRVMGELAISLGVEAQR